MILSITVLQNQKELILKYCTCYNLNPFLSNGGGTLPLTKICFFWSNPYNIKVKNLFHRNARVINVWLHNHIYNIICVPYKSFVDDVIEVRRPGVTSKQP